MENSTMHLPFYTSFKTFLSIFIVLLTGATLYAVDSMDLKKLKAGECEGCDLKFAQLQGLEMLGVNLFEANLQKQIWLEVNWLALDFSRQILWTQNYEKLH